MLLSSSVNKNMHLIQFLEVFLELSELSFTAFFPKFNQYELLCTAYVISLLPLKSNSVYFADMGDLLVLFVNHIPFAFQAFSQQF